MTATHEITTPLIRQHIHRPSTNVVPSVTPSSPDSEENPPIEQVALTVPTTDDTTLPTFTFRTWTLGALACILLSFLNQFFWYRREPLTITAITAISAQIAVVSLGHLMASITTQKVFLKGTKWEFMLNPGPFNVKEHVLITIFANSGAGNVYAVHIISAVKIFYKTELTFFCGVAGGFDDAGSGIWAGWRVQKVPGGACFHVVAAKSCSSFSLPLSISLF